MAISQEKYVSSTTFRKTGTPVPTPTWIVDLDGGRVGFWTSSQSGKYKRLRNNPKITLQPSDARGKVKAGTAPIGGSVSLSTSGADFDEVQRKVKAKYGFMVSVSKIGNTIGHLGKSFPYGDVAVVITLDES